MANYILEKDSFIADQLMAAGSKITDAFLNGSEPGSALIEVDDRGAPIDPADTARLLAIGVNLAPVQVAPIAPHAPNPTRPQAVPPHQVGAAMVAGDREYVAGDGVENNESHEARVARLETELAAAREAAAQVAPDDLEPEQPQRRGDDVATGGTDNSSDASGAGRFEGTIPQLEDHLSSVTDAAELQRLRDAETSQGPAKARKGALDAIDARFAELKA